MTDEVNNPSHYNQNGIEVIDVIETYAKDDFRLANVLKYVCRSGYKGNKLQDLEKAHWYLNRVIEELVEDRASIADRDHRTARTGYTPREVEVFFQGYDCRKQEEDEEVAEALADESWLETGRVVPSCTPYEEDITADWSVCDAIDKHIGDAKGLTFHGSLSSRIAGDDDAAQRIKDHYYKFDRFEIQGYCAWCDSEISLGQPFIKSQAFDAGVIFCKATCVDKLKEWQGR